MINPLVNDLNELSIQQMEEKVLKLQQRYFQTYNADLRDQIVNMIQMYNEEIRDRKIIEAQKQREENGDNDLDNLINVS